MSQKERARKVRHEPEVTLTKAVAGIAWVLEHPHMSDWLKQALRTADGLDPIALQNDIELLRHLLGPKSQAEVEIAMTPVFVD